MDNNKLKYILAKQQAISKNPSLQNKNVFIKMKYEDFALAYGMEISSSFEDMAFLARRIQDYRLGEKIKAILLEKDLIKVWLIKNAD
jgi:hypothetical protein